MFIHHYSCALHVFLHQNVFCRHFPSASLPSIFSDICSKLIFVVSLQTSSEKKKKIIKCLHGTFLLCKKERFKESRKNQTHLIIKGRKYFQLHRLLWIVACSLKMLVFSLIFRYWMLTLCTSLIITTSFH